jgi:hypothetical protein
MFFSLKCALFASVSSIVSYIKYLEENAIAVNIDRFMYDEKSFKVAWQQNPRGRNDEN